jgi:peptidyl-prolyl cis-trans isomerase SurA
MHLMVQRYIMLLLLTACAIIPLSGELHAAIMLDRVVAVVNKEVITWSELYKIMESEASEQTRALKDEEKSRVFRNSEAAFLEKLIDMKLQLQEAKRIGLQVKDDEVKEAIENIKKKYQMTDAALEESLKREGLTFEEYKKKIEEQILISQFINHQIKSKVVITDEYVKHYMETRKGSSSGEEEFRLRQIFFKKSKDDSMRREIEEKAAMIVQRLKAGEDFATLGWEYSEDPSAKIGSDLGYLKKSYMAQEFITVLSGMKVGDISNPFWTQQGLHIIKLEDKVSAESTAEQRANVRKQLEEEAFAEKYKSSIKGLRENARIEIRL